LNIIVDDLFLSPIVKITKIAKEHDITYPTAKADIDKLVGVNILAPLDSMAQKTFCAPEIFEITYRD
jgi:hypothetical protein